MPSRESELAERMQSLGYRLRERRQRMRLDLPPLEHDEDLLEDAIDALDEAGDDLRYLAAILEGRADPADREQIVAYLKYVASVEVGTILNRAQRETVADCAAWIENRVDEREARRTAMAKTKAAEFIERTAKSLAERKASTRDEKRDSPPLPTVADLLFRRSTFAFYGFPRVDVTKAELEFLWEQKDWARLDPNVPYELQDWIAKEKREGRSCEFLGVLRAGKCWERVVFLKEESR